MEQNFCREVASLEAQARFQPSRHCAKPFWELHPGGSSEPQENGHRREPTRTAIKLGSVRAACVWSKERGTSPRFWSYRGPSVKAAFWKQTDPRARGTDHLEPDWETNTAFTWVPSAALDGARQGDRFPRAVGSSNGDHCSRPLAGQRVGA